MESLIYYLLINLSFIILIMFIGWIFSLFKKQVTHIDSIWGLGFIAIALCSLYQSQIITQRHYLVLVLTCLWGFRLSIHLTIRNWGKGEDPRYNNWREQYGKNFWMVSLFKVFILQAAFLWVISFVLQWIIYNNEPASLSVLDILGSIVWLIGITFESVADFQLKKFLSDKSNKGKVMNKGLFKYSRHPNYFGETLIWWGFFIIALSTTNGLVAIISPLTITLVLLNLTGVAITEEQIIKEIPAYKDYIKTTNAYFPWFRKKK